MSKEVTKVESKEVSFLDSWDGPTGFENIGVKDIKQPFLTIQHKAVTGPDRKTVVLAPGDFVNSITKESYGSKIEVQVLRWEKVYVEWLPNGGDFVGKYSEEEALKLGKMDHHPGGKDIGWLTREGNTLNETYYFYCRLPEFKDAGLVIFGLKTTGLKHARNWLTRMFAQTLPSGKKAPIFYSTWILSTAANENPNGQEYFQIGEGKTTLIEPGRVISQEEFVKDVSPILEMLKSLDTSSIVEQKDDTETEKPDWQ